MRAHTANGHALALVVDQLEEALTFGDPAERARLAEGLAELLREPSLPCLLVTTTRSDHVPDLVRDMAALGSLLNTHALRHDLQPLPEKELHEAILRPTRARGIELEPGLSQSAAASSVASPPPSST